MHVVGVAEAVADAVAEGVADCVADCVGASVGDTVCDGVGDTVGVLEACDDEMVGVKVNRKIAQATRVNRYRSDLNRGSSFRWSITELSSRSFSGRNRTIRDDLPYHARLEYP
jgi:chloramphenicol 3-O-phosphotransferase